MKYVMIMTHKFEERSIKRRWKIINEIYFFEHEQTSKYKWENGILNELEYFRDIMYCCRW